MTYNILIFGAGAIGAFYGSRLAQGKDVEVSVICRSNYNAVKEQGFQVDSPYYGKYSWKPTNIYRNPKEAHGQRWDYVVVTTKSLPDVSDDSALLEGVIGEGTAIVLIQNGIGKNCSDRILMVANVKLRCRDTLPATISTRPYP